MQWGKLVQILDKQDKILPRKAQKKHSLLWDLKMRNKFVKTGKLSKS